MTLACDDEYFWVHKIIQISCSELFHPVSDVKKEPFDNESLQILRLKIDEQTLKKTCIWGK